MGKGVLGGFVAGLAGGIDRGMQRQQELERQQREEDRRQQEHDARMAETQRANDDRMALASAARPVQVDEGAGGMIKPPTMDNSDVGLPENASLPNGGLQPGGFQVQGQPFTDRASADAAAAKANTPEATDMRISQALRSRGNVVGAKQYEASARQSQLSSVELADRMWTHRIRDAMSQGHEGLASLVSDSQGGDLAAHRIKAVPTPDGKQVVYNKVNDDGSLTPMPQFTFTNDQDGVVRAGYMLDRSVTPETRYKNMVAEDKQTAAVSAKEKELALRERELQEVKIPNAETRAQLAEVRAQLAEVRANKGDSKVSREERMRYTTLFTDAGRRMQDTSKQLNTLRGDRAFMRRAQVQGSPEAQQVQELQDQLASHKQERELYQGLLAGAGKDDTPAASPAGGTSTKVPAATQAARDSDRAQILKDELVKAQQRLQQGDTRAQGDIDALNRELAGTKTSSVGLSNATPKNGAPAKAPVQVKSKAERDKLPRGTRYVGPDGETYIKQ